MKNGRFFARIRHPAWPIATEQKSRRYTKDMKERTRLEK